MRRHEKMRKALALACVLAAAVLLTNCSMKFGTFSEQTHFSYPNSNIKPLGKVQSTVSRTTVLIAPTLTAEHVRELMDKALAQKAGADLIIDVQVDTKLTMIPIPIFSIYTATMTLSGTAVSMEVGRQELQENLEHFGY